MTDYYGSHAGFDAYHTARGRNTNSYNADKVLAALVVASESLDSRYRTNFPGFKVGQRAQLREWPRGGGTDIYGYAISSETVPTEVENATYEMALRELIAPGSLSLDWTPNKYRRASVDGAVSVEYREFSSSGEVQTRFAVVDEILSPLLSARTQSPLCGATGR